MELLPTLAAAALLSSEPTAPPPPHPSLRVKNEDDN